MLKYFGVIENERADNLAKSATVKSEIDISFLNSLVFLKKANKWRMEDASFVCLFQKKGKQIKYLPLL